MEIGCLEGRSTLWFLDTVLRHASSSLVCVEPNCKDTFLNNINSYRDKIRLIQADSSIGLRDPLLKHGSLSFVYIDGDHRAPSVLEDAVLSFPLLTARGVMIFDDYLWESATPKIVQSMPKLAIDCFLTVFAGQYELVHRGYQVAIRKK